MSTPQDLASQAKNLLPLLVVVVTGVWWVADLRAQVVQADNQLDKRVTAIEQLNELKVNRDIQDLRKDLVTYKAGQDEILGLIQQNRERSDALEEILLDIRRELRVRNGGGG